MPKRDLISGSDSEQVMAAFIGVDLAWQSEGNHSGLAAFRGDRLGVDAVSVGDGATSLEAICRYILDHRSKSTVVAIDAPLIIANAAGQRPCEALVSRKFHHAHAGAYPSNLKLYPQAGGVALARMLEAEGFRHCTHPGVAWNESGDWFFEVYPHPAQVVLFGRDQIIRYKKGAVALRRSGLTELRELIRDRMIGPDRPLAPGRSLNELLTRDLSSLTGGALKRYEDALDAVFCAYLAFHLLRWGWDRSELLGDESAGYIVVPTVSLAGGAKAETDSMDPRAAELIGALDLAPHPEGGFYREIWRAQLGVEPGDRRGARSALTAIYFLLPADAVSRWHRVRSDEIWHHLEGAPLELLRVPPDALRLERVRLGPLAEGQAPIHCVPANGWQAARSLGPYTLVGCTVGPGFEFADFELLRDLPEQADALCAALPEAVPFR